MPGSSPSDEPLVTRQEQVARWITSVHEEVTAEFGRLDPGGTFAETRWERPDGSRGVARAMLDGNEFDRAGIDRCFLEGTVPSHDEDARVLRPENGTRFYAAAHAVYAEPRYADIPMARMAIRYVELKDATGHVTDAWFGGFAELASPVLSELDARHMDEQVGQLCDRVHPALHDALRLPHSDTALRNRAGVAFEQLRMNDHTYHLSFTELTRFLSELAQLFGFVCARTLSRDRTGGALRVRPARRTTPVREEQEFGFGAIGAPGTDMSFEAQLSAMLAPRRWIEPPDDAR